MDATIKAAWLTALRSGNYEQTHGTFVCYVNADSDIPARHCCLAVLADQLTSGNPEKHEVDGLLDDETLDQVGLTNVDQHVLAGLNDADASFAKTERLNAGEGSQVRTTLTYLLDEGRGPYTYKEIADYIEKHL